MPIRINLLAEAQAAEDFRRRDPVKRATWVGAFLVAAILAWASLLQARIALKSAQTSRLDSKIQSLKTEHREVVKNRKVLQETQTKLADLNRLHTNRYLSGNLLDALQRAYVEHVRVVKLKTQFEYTLTGATKPQTNGFKVTPGKPASAKEEITVQIDALDSSSNPGDQVSKYKESIASLPHLKQVFQDKEREVRLTALNPPQIDSSGRPYVLFTLECAYPEKVR